MATPYIKIQSSFYAKFQSVVLIPPELEKEFFVSALGDFELDLYSLNWNESLNEFEGELTNTEINLLGRCMYQAYLEREIDRIIKLTNVIGKDISLTGMGDAKRFSIQRLQIEEAKISEMKNKLKINSFYEEG